MDATRRPGLFDPLGDIVASARDLARMERSGHRLDSAEMRVLNALDEIAGVRHDIDGEGIEAGDWSWVDAEETDLIAVERMTAPHWEADGSGTATPWLPHRQEKAND